MVAGALDNGDRSGVAHGKALAGDAAEEALAFRRTVERGVADDDRLFRHDLGVLRGPHDDVAAGETLADVIVGNALELQRDTLGKEAAEALAGSALELHDDGIVRQPGLAVALGDLARQHRTGGTVDIDDRLLDDDLLAALDGPGRFLN